jgi:hypothetical protein
MDFDPHARNAAFHGHAADARMRALHAFGWTSLARTEDFVAW